MGQEIECCRRPQTQGKKDIKTYRGIQQKKLPNFKSPDIDDEDNFGTYNPNKNNEAANPSSYLDSIYANKNDFSSGENFPKFSNYEIEPVSEPIYSNQAVYQPVQGQENINMLQYENSQYINSYTTYPQENVISQGQFIETGATTTQYTQPQIDFQSSSTNNYVQSLPTKYINPEPIKYNTSEPINYNYTTSDPIQYANSSSSQYINSQNIQTTNYIESKPISYNNNTKIEDIQYVETPKLYTVSEPIQYIKQNSQNNEPQPKSEPQATYIEHIDPQSDTNYIEETDYSKYIEDSKGAKYIEIQKKPIYIEETKPTKYIGTYSQTQNDIQYLPSKNIEYVQEPKTQYVKSHTSSTQYISSQPEAEQIQYIEPQKQIEYTIPKIQPQQKQKQKFYIESQQQINSEPKQIQKKKKKKKYISKPITQNKNNENEKQNQIEQKQKEYKEKMSNSQSEDEYPDIQQEPEDLDLSEAEPQPHKYINNEIEERHEENNYKKNKNKRKMKYIDSEEENKVGSIYDEIKNKKNYRKNQNNYNNNNHNYNYHNKEERDFSPDGYKIFYPENDPFFKRPKGKKAYKVYDDEDNGSNQAIYEGEMLDGKKHGVGKLTTNEFVREGTWKNDKFTGWGRESRRNGEILEGRFINGKVEGKGILRDSQGSSYIGDFVDSKREGYGELDTEKAYYRGEFKNNKFHGHGRIKIKEDEREIEGIFRNGEIEKENANVFCGGKSNHGATVEKRKEITSCQGPGFISNFFSKIFS